MHSRLHYGTWLRVVRAPNGIRTRAAALKGRCPGPLDDEGAIASVGDSWSLRDGAGFPKPRRHARERSIRAVDAIASGYAASTPRATFAA